MTPTELSTAEVIELISSRFVPNAVPELVATYQIVFSDRTDLNFSVAIDHGRIDAQGGRREEFSLAIRMTLVDYANLLSGRVPLSELVAENRIQFRGRLDFAAPLVDAFGLERPNGVWRPEHIVSRVARRPALTRVETTPQPTPERFLEEFAKESVPVIFPDATVGWKCHGWQLSDLKRECGNLELDVRYDDYVSQQVRMPMDIRPMSIREYIDSIEAPAADRQWPPPYAQNNRRTSELFELVAYPTLFPRRAFTLPSIWIGPVGTITALHRDLCDNFLVMVSGRKRVVLVSPEHAPSLYIAPHYLLESSPVNPEKPDLERFPLSRDVPIVECEVGPGQMLFLPAGWFHWVEALEPSFSVNFFAGGQAPAAYPPS